jgi:hypothetical protein
MIVEMGACNVRDVRETGHLEMQSTAVKPAEFWGGKALVSEGVHEVDIIGAVGLGFIHGSELDFSFNGFEEPADAWHPAVLEVVEVGLCFFEDRCRGAGFELNPSNVDADLLA